ncbi:MAG: hypothetical protein ABIT71_08200 [Vicinamibacteraceae bacterium]
MLAVLLTAPGCHDAPTAPSPLPVVDVSGTNTPLRLSSERFLLQLTGHDDSFEPALSPPCVPIAVPRAGKHVTTYLWFTPEGDEFVGRSRPPYRSTLELRLRRVSSSPSGVVVVGSVSGAADDEYDRFLGLRDTRFAVMPGDTATVSGEVPPSGAGPTAEGRSMQGVVRGRLGFLDSGGAVAQCTNVPFLLQVLPFGGPDDDPSLPPLVPGVLR